MVRFLLVQDAGHRGHQEPVLAAHPGHVLPAGHAHAQQVRVPRGALHPLRGQVRHQRHLAVVAQKSLVVSLKKSLRKAVFCCFTLLCLFC